MEVIRRIEQTITQKILDRQKNILEQRRVHGFLSLVTNIADIFTSALRAEKIVTKMEIYREIKIDEKENEKPKVTEELVITIERTDTSEYNIYETGQDTQRSVHQDRVHSLVRPLVRSNGKNAKGQPTEDETVYIIKISTDPITKRDLLR